MLPDLATATAAIVAIGQRFDARGWAPATSGNYSLRLADGSVAVTVSGRHKGRLRAADVMRVDGAGASLDGQRPSAETGLHLQLYANPSVNAVLHSHSALAVALTRAFADVDGYRFEGHELLKALPGVTTHMASVTIPIVANSQDVADIAAAVALAEGGVPAYLIRGHGLYGWGRDMAEAERVIEAVEWLIACELAQRSFRA